MNKITKYVLIILIFVVLFAGGIFVWQYFGVPKEEVRTKLTLSAIENAEYYCLACCTEKSCGEKITLKNGSYEEGSIEEFTLNYSRIWHKPVFGDLNNDGKEDAAVVLSTTQGGSGDFRELAVLINQNGKPHYLTSVELGNLVIINSITIDSGIITVDMTTAGPDEPPSQPTQKEIIRYKLVGDQLEELPGETAAWQTYRNEEYGFEIKYPSGFFAESSSYGVDFTENQWRGQTVHYPFIGIEFIQMPLTPEEWANEKATGIDGVGQKFDPQKRVETISNNQFIMFQTRGVSGANDNALIQGNDNMLFNIYRHSSGMGEVQMDIYNQMLSTFEFLE